LQGNNPVNNAVTKEIAATVSLATIGEVWGWCFLCGPYWSIPVQTRTREGATGTIYGNITQLKILNN
jgi:hypothetical protein